MKRILTGVVGTIGLIWLPAMAIAATIAPIGDTSVEVTANLAGLGLGAEPLGTANVTVSDGGNPVFNFPITGGTIDPGGALIEHNGSGLAIFEIILPVLIAGPGPSVDGPADGPVLTAENLLIDTNLATVFGNVNGGTDQLALFSFGDTDDGGIDLLITDILATALSDTFGAPDLSGAVFGSAATNPVTGPAPDPSVIPLPAGLVLTLSSLGVLVLGRRFRGQAPRP